MKINYHLRKFRIIQSSGSGELDPGQVFIYEQNGDLLTCTYSGTSVRAGHILGKVNSEDGGLFFSYHQINLHGELSGGVCESKAIVLDSGKVRLHERWKWVFGKTGSGESILEEI